MKVTRKVSPEKPIARTGVYVRCDGCVARALGRIQFTFGVLELCGHHLNKVAQKVELAEKIVSLESIE
jgi:hypothetical protein